MIFSVIGLHKRKRKLLIGHKPDVKFTITHRFFYQTIGKFSLYEIELLFLSMVGILNPIAVYRVVVIKIAVSARIELINNGICVRVALNVK